MSKYTHIRDNKPDRKVVDFLKEKIQEDASLSIVSAYFSIYAFNALRESLIGIDNLRFLFGDPKSIAGIDPAKTESKVFTLTEEGLQLDNYLSQSEIAEACEDWIRKKVEIKSARRSNFLHGKMYHIDNHGQVDALIGSSNFTARGLGASQRANNIELNLEVSDPTDCMDLKTWFDDLWESDEVENVKKQVIRELQNAHSDQSPEFIYFKTLYHLFEKYLEAVNDMESAPEVDKSIFHTEIWKRLYKFQRDGVKACLQKLNTYNGCIIADSVGLGKTYEALAIIKYFELLRHRVLVLCPKKLERNWLIHLENNVNNKLRDDLFRYSVMAHTDLTRHAGTTTSGIDLSGHIWGGYDLVVIDESHNFRNRSTKENSRYNKLMESIIKSGGKTKVLMLSATPVNNRLTDLENQILFITADKDDAFTHIGIPSIKIALQTAQTRFDAWIKETEHLKDKSIRQDRLSESLNADFFSLLDQLTIARSRKHIQQFYSESMKKEKINDFPKHEPPKSLYPKIDLEGKFPTYQRISDQIEQYKLAVFRPSDYILEEYLSHYEDGRIFQREFNLIGMMRVNFLKRLESSIHSFRRTLKRTIEKIETCETGIENYLLNPTDNASLNPNAELEEVEEYQEDEELQAGFQSGKNYTYWYKHLDLETWLTDLRHDKTQLENILKTAEHIEPNRDAKMAELRKLIKSKVQSTKNDECKVNRKVLVFTAFADTANYLYDNLHSWVNETLNIQCAVVTGSVNRNDLVKNDFNEILTNFSPISKERSADANTPEIDLLIATDCISEGQNLQDCDYLVNYDIHWNPVRIIQRFGRIDRIGSKNKTIQLVNFWPTEELDKYINLKTRVEGKMALLNLTATGDYNPLSMEAEKQSLEKVWTHRDKQLLRMKDKILDFEDIEEQLNLNQFTLDDFRAQLLNYLQDDVELKEAPLGLYAVTEATTHTGSTVDIEPGVIFCLRQTNEAKENEILNPIHPYYLVHVSDKGKISTGFTNPKRILERFNKLCERKTTDDKALCDWFNEETDNGKNMKNYKRLIETALDSIQQEYNQKVNDQIDASADFLLPIADNQITEATKFELITWLVIAPS